MCLKRREICYCAADITLQFSRTIFRVVRQLMNIYGAANFYINCTETTTFLFRRGGTELLTSRLLLVRFLCSAFAGKKKLSSSKEKKKWCIKMNEILCIPEVQFSLMLKANVKKARGKLIPIPLLWGQSDKSGQTLKIGK